jgi:guanylate kinase
LEGRGTETKEVIQNRVNIGVGEIRDAKKLDYFVKTFVNDDFEVFYSEFKQFLQSTYINHNFKSGN